jgi:hypothetical protein
MEQPEIEETCGICRDALIDDHAVDKRLARVSCQRCHVFHYECISEWAAIENTCPIDRMTYTTLQVSEGGWDSFVEEAVSCRRQKPANFLAYVEDVRCEQCQHNENEDVLLLCDQCNKAYHIYCLRIPLSTVPEGSWYCDNCWELQMTRKKRKKNQQRPSSSIIDLHALSRRKRARAIWFLQSRIRKNDQHSIYEEETAGNLEEKEPNHHHYNVQEISLDDIWRQWDQFRQNQETKERRKDDISRGKRPIKKKSLV